MLASFLFFFPQFCLAQTSFDANYWNLLLHEHQDLFGHWKSEAHSPDFFVSPDGGANPEAELKASLQVIAEKRPIQNQAFECVFPARYHYLKSSFGLKDEEAPCPRLQEWKAQFSGESATVVFASSYMGNASSIFGHVFLKINAKPGLHTRGELLDLGLSFAAKNDPSDSPLTFVWKGLTGGYVEELSIMTYFTRLAEYHNIENRDVWEYKLKLSVEQVNRLLDHVWELQDSKIKYYFINRNCAYHLWTLLQIAHPESSIGERDQYWVLPTDVLKSLAQVGMVSQVQLRPSIYHKLKQKILAMSDEEKADFEKSRQSELKLDGHESSLVIEGLLDYQQFTLHPPNRDLLPVEQAKQDELFHQLTISQISNSPLPSIVAESQPDLGQASKKLSFLVGSSQSDNFTELELRPTLHDLLDKDEGYASFSQVEAGRVRLHYSETQNKVNLQNLELLNIVSLTPIDSLLVAPSWLVEVGALVPPDAACAGCLSGSLQMGTGLSAYAFPKFENGMTFAMLKLNFEGGSGTPGSFRFGPSELVGFDIRLGRAVKFLNEFEITEYMNGQWASQAGAYSVWTTGLSWSLAKNFELRLNGSYQWLPTQSYLAGNLATGFYF